MYTFSSKISQIIKIIELYWQWNQRRYLSYMHFASLNNLSRCIEMMFNCDNCLLGILIFSGTTFKHKRFVQFEAIYFCGMCLFVFSKPPIWHWIFYITMQLKFPWSCRWEHHYQALFIESLCPPLMFCVLTCTWAHLSQHDLPHSWLCDICLRWLRRKQKIKWHN